MFNTSTCKYQKKKYKILFFGSYIIRYYIL